MQAQAAQGMRGFLVQRLAGQAADLGGQRMLDDRAAVDGGVAGDDAVDAGGVEHAGDAFDLGFREVGRDLDQQRHAVAAHRGQVLLRAAQFIHQHAQRLFALQVAQTGGVRRGDVDGDVVGVVVHPLKAVQVVVDRLFVRGVLVLADVDAEDALALGAFDVAHQRVDAAVVEAQAVDHRQVLGQAEHAWLRIAWLRPRRDRADLDEAEAERHQRVDVLAVLVQPGGAADRVGEFDAEGLGRQRLGLGRQGGDQAAAVGGLEPCQTERVRALGVHPEQQGPGQRIHQTSNLMPCASGSESE